MSLVVAALLTLSAASPMAPQFPSCDLKAQHALKGDTGGSVKDPRQAHILLRADILQADLGNARKARRLTQASTDRLYRRVTRIRTGANRLTRQQGFLSAAEVASYDRDLDAIAQHVCRR